MNDFRLFRILFLGIIYSSLNSLGTAYQCCGFNRMDSQGLVLVEASRVLPLGRYQAIKFRSCDKQQIAIQLWNCDATNSGCRFLWQTVAQTAASDQSINFEPITISVNDRLGIFATANSSAFLPIPFGQDILANLYRSTTQFSDAFGFSTNSQITLNKVSMSRSFAMSIIFCENKDCVGLPTDALAPPLIIRDNINQPALGQCCKSQVGCDSLSLSGQIDANTVVIQQLQLQIQTLNQLINTLTDQARPVTGVCPQGFTAGTYGLGTCYAAFYNPVSFAVAAFYCRDNFVANLVSIGSLAEEQFLSNFVSNQVGGLGRFWTSGMYQLSDSTWYWYDKRSESLQYQYFSWWKNRVVPTPVSKDDVCSNLVVEKDGVGNVTDYWVKANCNDRRYFICEIAKICF